MKNIPHLIKKEFLQIKRNRQILPMLTLLPVIQVIVLSLAANYEIRNIKIAIIDHDLSQTSYQLVNKFTGSGFFGLVGYYPSHKKGMELLERDEADLLIEIPDHFERDLVRENKSPIQLLANAVNNQKAIVANAYASAISRDFNMQIRMQSGYSNPLSGNAYSIETVTSNWYNPLLNYKTLMVPGILAIIVSILIMVVSSMNIVREKEIGTIEQLNVTPIKKYEFIIGKLVPFWIMGHIIFWVGLTAGKIIFNIPFIGSPLLLELFLACYLPVMLGIGLFISTMVETQQQAMFISFFFILIFVLMSGFFTPIENMPLWAQYADYLNPVRYMVEVNRLVILKGSSVDVIGKYIGIMLLFAFLINSFAIFRYKKTV